MKLNPFTFPPGCKNTRQRVSGTPISLGTTHLWRSQHALPLFRSFSRCGRGNGAMSYQFGGSALAAYWHVAMSVRGGATVCVTYLEVTPGGGNVGSLDTADELKSAARELVKYKADLVGLWKDTGCIEPAANNYNAPWAHNAEEVMWRVQEDGGSHIVRCFVIWGPSWDATQGFPNTYFMEHESSLPCSQNPATGLYDLL
jgi:hypothetical protein